MRKPLAATCIVLLIICLGSDTAICMAAGGMLGFSGDLVNNSFQGNDQERREASSQLFVELNKITREYVSEHELTLIIGGFQSSESIGLSPETIGTDIEAFADAFGQDEFIHKPTSNLLCLVYIASSNEFAYRVYVSDDENLDVDWNKVEKIFCSADDIPTKYRRVCSFIAEGTDPAEAESHNASYIPVIVVALSAAAIIILAIILSQKSKRSV